MTAAPTDTAASTDTPMIVPAARHPEPPRAAAARPAATALPDARGVLRAAAWWTVATIAGIAVVAYLVGPLIAARDQRALLAELRADVSDSVGAVSDSLLGAAPVTRSPAIGDPVALLQVPRLGLQQVVVEGAAPSQTRSAPGHLPGTAAPGQPGNAVVAGRHLLYGKAFARLDELRTGDQLIVSSVQGQSLYVVSERRTSATYDDATAGATPDDRLTLVTSASRLPWASGRATVVVAQLKTKPFTPTPQNGRSDSQDGRSSDPASVPLTLLCLLAFTTVAVATTVLYRRWSALGTYVATTPALLGLIVPTALAASLLLPAWS